MANPERIIKQAEQVIEDASELSLSKNYSTLQNEREGNGCGCLSCKRTACNELNKDVEFISKGRDPVRWEVDKKGDIVYKVDFDRLNNLPLE